MIAEKFAIDVFGKCVQIQKIHLSHLEQRLSLPAHTIHLRKGWFTCCEWVETALRKLLMFEWKNKCIDHYQSLRSCPNIFSELVQKRSDVCGANIWCWLDSGLRLASLTSHQLLVGYVYIHDGVGDISSCRLPSTSCDMVQRRWNVYICIHVYSWIWWWLEFDVWMRMLVACYHLWDLRSMLGWRWVSPAGGGGGGGGHLCAVQHLTSSLDHIRLSWYWLLANYWLCDELWEFIIIGRILTPYPQFSSRTPPLCSQVLGMFVVSCQIQASAVL